METKGLGAGSYPTPQEKNMKDKNVKIYFTITTSDNFPKHWDDDEIKLYIKANIDEYIRTCDIEIEEIEL